MNIGGEVEKEMRRAAQRPAPLGVRLRYLQRFSNGTVPYHTVQQTVTIVAWNNSRNSLVCLGTRVQKTMKERWGRYWF